jgi:hypothetical protein
MDHQFKEDRKTVPTLKNSSISPRKNISGTYLIYRLFARGRATSKNGGGGRYGAVLMFKGEQFKKMNERKFKGDVRDFQGESLTKNDRMNDKKKK